MIAGVLDIPVAANWPKLHAELASVLGRVGFSHDDLPGPVRVLADAPLAPGLLARAQDVVNAHDPTPTPQQRQAARGRLLLARLQGSGALLAALVLRSSSRWASLPPEEQRAQQALIDAATEDQGDALA